jgi:foldase protein PrsA
MEEIMKTRALVLIGAVLLLVSGLAAQQANPQEKVWQNADQVAARVDGVPITKGDVLQALWDWSGDVASEELIDQQVVLNAAKKKGVEVTDQEIADRLKQVESSLPPGQGIEDVLRMSGMTLARLRARLRTQLLIEKILADQIDIPDSELDQVHARHILIRIAASQDPKDAEAADQQARQKALQAKDRLAAGEAFESVARDMSEDPLSKGSGGDLGFLPRGRMPKEFDDVAFSLEPGRISDPVRTSLGYHIIMVVEKKPGSALSPEEKQALRAQALERLAGPKMQEWFQQEKSKAKIERLLQSQ